MKLEIRKEYGLSWDQYFFNLYRDGVFTNAYQDLEEAMRAIARIRELIKNPKKPELIYSEEIN